MSSIYANTVSGPAAMDATVTTGHRLTEMVSAGTAGNVPPELTPQAAFKQRVIELDSDGQSLRLWDDATLRLNLVCQEFEVEGWGIRMPMGEAASLPREMARQFLRLWSRAERGQLAGAEQRYWQHIVDHADYQAFCAERAPLLYTEGEVVGRTHEGTTVKWADGHTEILRGKPRRALDLVNAGELFSASAKCDRSGRTRQVENATVLGSAHELLQEMDDDWILKA